MKRALTVVGLILLLTGGALALSLTLASKDAATLTAATSIKDGHISTLPEGGQLAAAPPLSNIYLARCVVMDDKPEAYDFVARRDKTVNVGVDYSQLKVVCISLIDNSRTGGVPSFDLGDLKMRIGATAPRVCQKDDLRGEGCTASAESTTRGDPHRPAIIMEQKAVKGLSDAGLYYRAESFELPPITPAELASFRIFEGAHKASVLPEAVAKVITGHLDRIQYVNEKTNFEDDFVASYSVRYEDDDAGPQDYVVTVNRFHTRGWLPGSWNLEVAVDPDEVIKEASKLDQRAMLHGALVVELLGEGLDGIAYDFEEDVYGGREHEHWNDPILIGPADERYGPYAWTELDAATIPGWTCAPQSATVTDVRMNVGQVRDCYWDGIVKCSDTSELSFFNRGDLSKTDKRMMKFSIVWGPKTARFDGSLLGQYRTSSSDWKSFEPVPGGPSTVKNIYFGAPGNSGCTMANPLTGHKGGNCRWSERWREIDMGRDSIPYQIIKSDDAYPNAFHPEDTLMLIGFDTQYDIEEPGADLEEIALGIRDMFQHYTADFANVKNIWLAGSSRGGALVTRLSKLLSEEIANNHDVAGTPGNALARNRTQIIVGAVDPVASNVPSKDDICQVNPGQVYVRVDGSYVGNMENAKNGEDFEAFRDCMFPSPAASEHVRFFDMMGNLNTYETWGRMFAASGDRDNLNYLVGVDDSRWMESQSTYTTRQEFEDASSGHRLFYAQQQRNVSHGDACTTWHEDFAGSAFRFFYDMSGIDSDVQKDSYDFCRNPAELMAQPFANEHLLVGNTAALGVQKVQQDGLFFDEEQDIRAIAISVGLCETTDVPLQVCFSWSDELRGDCSETFYVNESEDPIYDDDTRTDPSARRTYVVPMPYDTHALPVSNHSLFVRVPYAGEGYSCRLWAANTASGAHVDPLPAGSVISHKLYPDGRSEREVLADSDLSFVVLGVKGSACERTSIGTATVGLDPADYARYRFRRGLHVAQSFTTLTVPSGYISHARATVGHLEGTSEYWLSLIRGGATPAEGRFVALSARREIASDPLGQIVDFTFPWTPFVESGEKYWIVFHTLGTGVLLYLEDDGVSPTSGYPGQSAYTDDSGAWIVRPVDGHDIDFEVRLCE